MRSAASSSAARRAAVTRTSKPRFDRSRRQQPAVVARHEVALRHPRALRANPSGTASASISPATGRTAMRAAGGNALQAAPAHAPAALTTVAGRREAAIGANAAHAPRVGTRAPTPVACARTHARVRARGDERAAEPAVVDVPSLPTIDGAAHCSRRASARAPASRRDRAARMRLARRSANASRMRASASQPASSNADVQRAVEAQLRVDAAVRSRRSSTNAGYARSDAAHSASSAAIGERLRVRREHAGAGPRRRPRRARRDRTPSPSRRASRKLVRDRQADQARRRRSTTSCDHVVVATCPCRRGLRRPAAGPR